MAHREYTHLHICFSWESQQGLAADHARVVSVEQRREAVQAVIEVSPVKRVEVAINSEYQFHCEHTIEGGRGGVMEIPPVRSSKRERSEFTGQCPVNHVVLAVFRGPV